MTEDEAKTKWCHERSHRYMYMSMSSAMTVNIIPTIEGKEEVMEQVLEKQKAENDRCVASECMQWRWTPKFTANLTGQIIAEADHDPYTVGYCGLGGKE